MSSINYGGKLLMKAGDDNKSSNNNYEDCFDSYPFEIPKVYLDGTCEAYFPQIPFSWDDDSVVLVRNKQIIEYTQSRFAELLAKDKDGNLIWVDGRTAPYKECWDGEYLDETRGSKEYTVTEYDIDTAQKKKYKMVLDETTSFDTRDYYRLSNFVDAETLGSHFEIKDGILHSYIGKDKDLIIPECVTKVARFAFMNSAQFESITIPKSLIDISAMTPMNCKVKNITVAKDNPKYYTKNGCLIDKETGILVWGYTGNTIPDDGSIKKIGAYAFFGREDLESIILPNTITEIEQDAFKGCINLKNIVIPDSVIKIGMSAFSRCEKLTKINLPSLLTTINNCTFANCTSLESVNIPDSLQTIEMSIFANCDSLKGIDLPEECIKETKVWFGKRLTKENNKWCVMEPKEQSKPTDFAGFNF